MPVAYVEGATRVRLRMTQWTPTRAEGLARLQDFVPRAARAYASTRNYDLGPEDRSNVSVLSPWIRRRLVTEPEVIAAVRERWSASSAEKFIQEVCWRTYWKGWLELRPHLLRDFNDERIALKARLETDRALRTAVDRAKSGQTGIACFDAWVRELIDIGWLHNHARMWFASIWIFTLELPWQIGADFFFKHLLDADPASNTLSWRWVAGIQTPGRNYIARAENIERYTRGRFDPRGELDERAEPLAMPAPVPKPQPLAEVPALPTRAVLLLSEEDLHPESWRLPATAFAAVAAIATPEIADEHRPAARFARGALHDALERAAAHFNIRSDGVIARSALASWARAHHTSDIVTPYAPVGLVAWMLDELTPALHGDGVTLTRYRRPWDEAAWPFARRGFFDFKRHIPTLIAEL